MNFFLILLFSVFFSLFSGIQASFASEAPQNWSLPSGSLDLSMDFSYLTSEQNFNAKGALFKKSDGTISDLSTTLRVRYFPSTRFSFFLQSTLSRINSDFHRDTKTKFTGLKSHSLGIRYALATRSNPPSQKFRKTKKSKDKFQAVTELSVTLPQVPKDATPSPIDTSTDIQAMVTFAWLVVPQLDLSFATGILKRNSGYAQQFPYSLRGDIYITGKKWLPKLWLELSGVFGEANDTGKLDESTSSLLYVSKNPLRHSFHLGMGMEKKKSPWGFSLAYSEELLGSRAAHTKALALNIRYRFKPEKKKKPIPLKDKISRLEEIAEDEEIEKEKEEYDDDEVERYRWKTPILKVSQKGNFVKIGLGSSSKLKIDDVFHIFRDRNSSEVIAEAAVAALKENSAFLKIRRTYDEDVLILRGMIAKYLKKSTSP